MAARRSATALLFALYLAATLVAMPVPLWRVLGPGRPASNRILFGELAPRVFSRVVALRVP